MYKILIPNALSGTGVKYLKEKGCEVLLGSPASPEDPLLETCDAILAGAGSKIIYEKSVLNRLTSCKIIANYSAGFDYIDAGYAAKKRILVTNSGTANSNAVAEQTMLLLLSCAKNQGIMSNAARRGDFALRKLCLNSELSGAVLGLIGFGNIGRLVAQKAIYGFGMKVLAYAPHLTKENAPEGVEPVSDCNEIYKNGDFISLHVPLTDETKYMVARKQFDMMKPGAYIINVSRGGIIKEKDLLWAIKEKKIRGAGLDVFEQEPLPKDSELTQYENIILSPHSAANTRQALENMELYAAQDIWRVLNGEAPRFPVNHP